MPRAAAARFAALARRLIPNLELYLTGFLKGTFSGGIAKKRGLCGRKVFQFSPVNHALVNHAAALALPFGAR